MTLDDAAAVLAHPDVDPRVVVDALLVVATGLHVVGDLDLRDRCVERAGELMELGGALRSDLSS